MPFFHMPAFITSHTFLKAPASRRREFCHCADALSPSLLKRLLQAEVGAAE